VTSALADTIATNLSCVFCSDILFSLIIPTSYPL
jgi:hypothetical protein